MCMYCSYYPEVIPNEKSNNSPALLEFKDGSHLYSILLNRYSYEDEKDYSLSIVYRIDNQIHNELFVWEQKVAIKYCPICGKKLYSHCKK